MPEGQSFASFIQFFTGLGGFGVLVIVTWAWYTGKIVTRREFDDERARVEEWKSVALRSVDNNRRLQGTAEDVAGVVKEVIRSQATNEQR